MQVAVIDVETFVVDDIRIWPHRDAMLDWFCADGPGLHAVPLRDWEFPVTAKAETPVITTGPPR